MKKSSLAATLAALFLTACGGGGESEAPKLAASPEGMYFGNTSTGKYFNLLVLDGGVSWALYGTAPGVSTSSQISVAEGVINAPYGKYDGTTYSASDLRDYSNRGVNVGSMTATYLAGASAKGIVQYADGQSVNFSAAAPSTLDYQYDKPALLSDIAGEWSGSTINNVPASMTIAADGEMTGSSPYCKMDGRAVPRGSRKNVFDVAVVFSGSNCKSDGATVHGVAVTVGLPGNRHRFVMTLVNGTRQNAEAFIAER